MAMVSVVYW